MKIQKMLAIAVLALGSLGALMPTSNVANASGWGEYHTNGPASCNCGEEPEEHQVCVSTTVEVEVGSSIVKVKTGVTEGTCASKTLKPGECLYYIYNFKCKESFWSGITCKYVSAGTKTRKATTTDCPDGK